MITRLTRRLTVTVALGVMAGAILGVGPAASVVPTAESLLAKGPILEADRDTAVEGSFIVVFKSDTKPEDTPRHADELATKNGGQSRFVYTAALQGFNFLGTDDQASRIAADPRVDSVSKDQTYTTQALGVQIGPPSWGLDRIDERSLPLDNKYHFPNTAGSVTAFVIDTGILLNHQEFLPAGRAICGFDPFLGGCAPCNQGHGTHVAGTIAGSTTGVAKAARIVSVRVFGCTPTTTAAVIIAGVNFVTLAQQLNPAMRSVANMSLGGPAFAPLNLAVTNSILANVHYSVAAGNNGGNACAISPASTPLATTVSATDITDTRPVWANFGGCVDLFAPGVNIRSAWHTAVNAYQNLNGTSMAAPHAAGTAALWRHKFPADTAVQTAAALNGNATPNVVIGPNGSPNLLLFMGMVPV